MDETTSFPQFLRLPPELQDMVWKEFARAEAASRIVVVHSSVVVERPSNKARYKVHLMPPKRLVSPLLLVNAQSRQAALRHYNTPVNLYELGSPDPWRPLSGLESTDVEGNTWIQAYEFPRAAPWGLERRWVGSLEYLVSQRAREEISTGREGAIKLLAESGSQQYPQRGCVHLDFETDRFLFYDRWSYHRAVRPQPYGLRAFADAMLDYMHHRTPFDLAKILERSPPVLRNASAELPSEMLARIRNVVFELPSDAASRRDAMTAVGLAAGRVDSYVMSTRKSNVWLKRCLRRAFSPEGSIGGYVTTTEVGRYFYDDIEDKGTEHLRIAKAKLVRGPDDAEGEKGWLDWATDD